MRMPATCREGVGCPTIGQLSKKWHSAVTGYVVGHIKAVVDG